MNNCLNCDKYILQTLTCKFLGVKILTPELSLCDQWAEIPERRTGLQGSNTEVNTNESN